MQRQRRECGATLTTRSQSTATVVSRKQWPTYSAAGYLMSPAPAKTSSHAQRGRAGTGVCPEVAIHCMKDTTEEDCRKADSGTRDHCITIVCFDADTGRSAKIISFLSDTSMSFIPCTIRSQANTELVHHRAHEILHATWLPLQVLHIYAAAWTNVAD